jgi:hypothetical protein
MNAEEFDHGGNIWARNREDPSLRNPCNAIPQARSRVENISVVTNHPTPPEAGGTESIALTRVSVLQRFNYKEAWE